MKPIVSLTFDDGYKEHYTHIAPIIERYDMRGLFSISPALIGANDYMSWADVNDLIARGHDIAAHARTHVRLTDLPRSEASSQIIDSKHMIEDMTGYLCRYFSFPHGKINSYLADVVRSAGMSIVAILRYNFGEGDPRLILSADALSAIVSNLSRVSLKAFFRSLVYGPRMLTVNVHGVVGNGPTWMPFRSPKEFENFVRKIREHEIGGKISVMKYTAAMDDFLRLRGYVRHEVDAIAARAEQVDR